MGTPSKPLFLLCPYTPPTQAGTESSSSSPSNSSQGGWCCVLGSPCTVCSPSFLCGVSSVHSYLCVWTPAFLTTPPEATSAQRLGSYLKGLTQAPKFPSVKDCFSLTGTLGMRERKPTLVSITRNLQNPKPNTLPPSIRTRISGSQWRLPPSPPPVPTHGEVWAPFRWS